LLSKKDLSSSNDPSNYRCNLFSQKGDELMKVALASVALFSIGYALGTPSGALGQPTLPTQGHVSYSMYGGNANTGHGINMSNSDTDEDGTVAEASLGPITGSYDNNEGTVGAAAGSSLADDWRMNAATSAEAVADVGASFNCVASGSTTLQDSLTFYSSPTADNPSGLIHVSGYLNLVGTVHAGAFGSLNVDAIAITSVSVIGTGMTTATGSINDVYQTVPTGSGSVPTLMHNESSFPAPTSIPYSWTVIGDVPFPISVELNVASEVHVVNQSYANPTIGTASADALFSHTLTWGGITSVTNGVTDEPITGWTVTSTSGFDYTRTVPEPSSLVLLAGCMALLAFAGLRPGH
jgi:hypothetical protein